MTAARPERITALAQCYRALKPGGKPSITQIAFDPHYQPRSAVRKLAERAGFLFLSIEGKWWFYTARFARP
jgi:ubiquinone/menaquinone biosynthesis C-methylase UbiE